MNLRKRVCDAERELGDPLWSRGVRIRAKSSWLVIAAMANVALALIRGSRSSREPMVLHSASSVRA
jgi:hypothetical protein